MAHCIASADKAGKDVFLAFPTGLAFPESLAIVAS